MGESSRTVFSINRQKSEFSNEIDLLSIKSESEDSKDESPELIENNHYIPERFKIFIESMKTLIVDPDYVIKNHAISEICHKYIEERFYIWSVQSRSYDQSSNFQQNLDSFKNALEYYAWDLIYNKRNTALTLQFIKSHWVHEEMVGCGILQQVGVNAEFSDKILQKYFAAGYILRMLETRIWGNGLHLCIILMRVLSCEKYHDIRLIINEGLSLNSKILDNFNEPTEKMKNLATTFVDNFKETVSIIAIYAEDLTHIIKLINGIIQHGNYGKVTEFITKTFIKIMVSIKTVQNFENYINFTFDFLNGYDLKFLLNIKNIFHELLTSNLFPKVAKFTALKLERKVRKTVIKQALMHRLYYSNILFKSLEYNIKEPKKFKILFEILQIYCTQDEILSMVSDNTKNLIHEGKEIRNHKVLNEIFQCLESCFNSEAIFKLFEHKISYFGKDRNALQQFYFGTKTFTDTESQVVLWFYVLKNYNESEKLKKLVMESCNDVNNLVHYLVSYNLPLTIRFALNTLKNNLTAEDYHEVLNSKGFKERNLLQNAVDKYVSLEVFQTIWDIMNDESQDNEEFKNILEYRDNNGNNLLHVITTFSTHIILKFVIEKIKKIFSHEDIKQLLLTKNKWNENLFQSAVKLNLNVELHTELWKIFHDFFDSNEIVDCVRHIQNNCANLLHIAVAFANLEIVELTWDEIENIMDLDEQKEYLQMKGFNGISLNDCFGKTKYFNVSIWVKNLIRQKEIA